MFLLVMSAIIFLTCGCTHAQHYYFIVVSAASTLVKSRHFRLKDHEMAVLIISIVIVIIQLMTMTAREAISSSPCMLVGLPHHHHIKCEGES